MIETLSESVSKLFMLAVERSQDGIVIGDNAGYITYVNPAIMQLLESNDRNDFVGKHILEFVHPADYQRALDCSLEAVSLGLGWKGQFTAVSKSGAKHTVELTVSPISDETGKKVAFIDVVRDVTERVNNEKQLYDTQRNLELANEKLLVMGGLVRHDIANKLNSLNLAMYKAKRDANLEALFSAAQTASSQINRTLNFSRDYEMIGKEPLGFLKVGNVFQESVALFPTNNLKVTNECGQLEVLADSLLKELFYNLIDNTLKYGKTATGIKLSYTAAEDGLRLVYEDNGAGISAENKSKLFTKGYGQGTGLGLYLIKKTVEVYGWQISEMGTEGENARFEMVIPQTKYKP